MSPTIAMARAAARTQALKQALAKVQDWHAAVDLLFLEAWETDPAPGAAAALRIAQIRRANPVLAAEIRAELKGGRPLTPGERDALADPPPAKPRPRAAAKASL